MLSEIENPPSTDATPSITPSDCRVARPRFSRISTQELRIRSRKAPVSIVCSLSPRERVGVRGELSPTIRLSRSLCVTNEPVFDLDATLRQPRDGEVMRDDQDRVALLVELGEELEHFVAGLLVERAGRLVSQEHRRPVGERAGDRDALRLSAESLEGSTPAFSGIPT